MEQLILSLTDESTTIADYFFWGMISGSIGYAFLVLLIEKSRISSVSAFFIFLATTFLTGLMGGLFAIVFDNNIETSIIVGSMVFFIYTSVVKAMKSGSFFSAIKELIIKLIVK